MVDVGCGPGNLTGLLASRWPQAVIEGIDSSPEMIAAAPDVPRVSFAIGDAADWQPTGDVDVVVSNAALQWIPRHQELMAKWACALPRGGWLAVQVPGNFDSPSHALMRSLAASARWSPALGHRGAPYRCRGRAGVPRLERIAMGASIVDPALVHELVSTRRRDDPLAVLSTREQEVLALMAEGRSNVGIAHRLWVTEGTVEKHVHHIFTKLSLAETGDDHRRVLAALTYLQAC